MKNKFNSGLVVLILLVVFGLGYSVYKIINPHDNAQPKVSMTVSTERSDSYDPQLAKAYKKEYIAALYIEGTIEELNAFYDQKWLMNCIETFKLDKNNVALAIYINSPGGAVYQADEIYLALQDYKSTTGRPIYVYQGPMAASGGYYISCAANEIYANRNTLTGCIGVIMGNSMDMTEFLEKIGIKSTTIHSGKNKNMMNYNETFTEEQQKIMQSICDECYEQFVTIVARSRHISYDRAAELSDGRIYTAKQALENDLIDHIDSWEHMTEDLANKIEKPGIKIVTYKKERKTSMLDLLSTKAKNYTTAMVPLYLYK